MSTYANVFVRTDATIRDFAGRISRLLGKPLDRKQMGESDVYETDLLGLGVVVFSQPGRQDDQENNLTFTRYQVQIDIGPTTGAAAHDALVAALSVHLAGEITAKLKCPTMVADGLRKRVATFGAEG